VNRERHPAASIPVLAHRLLAAFERAREICSRAENPSVACDDCALDARVNVDECKGAHELVHHRVGEGIVAAGAVQGDEYGGGGSRGVGGDVREKNLFEGEVCVGLGESNLFGDGRHDLSPGLLRVMVSFAGPDECGGIECESVRCLKWYAAELLSNQLPFSLQMALIY